MLKMGKDLLQIVILLPVLFLCCASYTLEIRKKTGLRAGLLSGLAHPVGSTPGLSPDPAGRTRSPSKLGRDASPSRLENSPFNLKGNARGFDYRRTRWRQTLNGSLCGEYLQCICAKNHAYCDGGGNGTVTYIPKIPPWVQELVMFSFDITPDQLMRKDFFANVSHIISLSLVDCGINEVQKEMFHGLKTLRKLSLMANGINSYKSMREALSVPGLQSLDLRGNKLNTSPPENVFRGLQSTVRNVKFSDNSKLPLFYNLSEFAYIPDLTYLGLEQNKIYSITSIRPLPKPTELALDE
jgi:hypothetical protein